MITEKLLIRLKNAYSVTVMTGAGISAESGIPTFRGKDGLWKDQKVEELAHIDAFHSDPEKFWTFYNWRRERLKDVKPNLGHYALVDMERFYDDFLVITQNVDNLHRLAGSHNLIEIHGNITRNRCPSCNRVTDSGGPVEKSGPKCSACGSIMRPDVVLFGENLDSDILNRAREAAASCEVFFSIGTSGVVEPAASLPLLAKANGAYLVEINAEETPLSIQANESIRASSGKLLPHLAIIIEKMFSRK